MSSEGRSGSQTSFGVTDLASEIAERIGSSGPITFAEFMREALYSPRGYYRGGGRVAASGDYFTAPTAHPGFGALLALQLRDLWRLDGRRDDYTIVEMGAGDGLLARDVSEYGVQLDPEFADSVTYLAFDEVPGGAFHEVRSMAELPRRIHGCVVSNELLDAFPVHRFIIEQGRTRELYVGVDRDRLVERPGPPSSPLIKQRVGRFAERLPTGYRGEVNLDIDRWAGQVDDVLESGHIITIDYGFDRGELYSPNRMEGSLRCYYRHTLRQDPLTMVGRQDMTAHVDFTAVDDGLAAKGFSSIGRTSQSSFLENLGIERWVQELGSMEMRENERRINMAGLLQITNPGGMGRFLVDVHGRDVEGVPVRGLSGDRTAGPEGPVPLLGDYPGHVDVTAGTPSAGQWFEVPSFEHLLGDEA